MNEFTINAHINIRNNHYDDDVKDIVFLPSRKFNLFYNCFLITCAEILMAFYIYV